ncbi:MAG: hypothetical protein A2527_06470 [Candidatus Lambdaproteobacteria bacterium RIFOXYD2_FULL_50_16]|uniref:Chemotaxis protein CheA n=1 Tax=Candidatus Lambdaproteobacteria bacterium RIFOXYD2_FULL_50_16 TaxID=1817772 RepID=A0A1F6GA43_9PROT|nr:MAG: hypothetical protein A2527_06470 [Candidatus Lambdaproteobacteria bacterium RIFOXYD2_FULL_50_16]
MPSASDLDQLFEAAKAQLAQVQSFEPEERLALSTKAFDLFSQLMASLAEETETARSLEQNFATPSFFEAPNSDEAAQKKAAFYKRLDFLAGLGFLKGKSLWVLGLLAALSQGEEFSPERPILTEYRPVNGLYLVNDPVEISYSGTDSPLAKNINLFGESACLAGEQLSGFTVRLRHPAWGLYIPKNRLLSVLPWNLELQETLLEAVLEKETQDLRFTTKELLQATERARLAQEILDNIGQASFSIDSKGEIGPNYSAVAARYIGEPKLAGLPFADLILRNDKKGLKSYYRALAMIFGGNRFDPKVVLSLLPSQVELAERQYRLFYYFSEDRMGYVTNVFVRMEDVTEAIKIKDLQSKTASTEAHEKKVQEKIRGNVASYLSLIEMIEKNQAMLEDFSKQIKASNQLPHTQDQRQLLKNLHSIKGLCSQFDLDDLKTAVHQMEDGVQGLATPEGVPLFHQRLEALNRHYRHASSLLESLGGEIVQVLMGVNFSQSEYEQLLAAAEKEDWEQVKGALKSKTHLPAQMIAENWEADLKSLGQKLGKEIRFKAVCTEGLRLPKAMIRQLNFELRHVYRNAADHGLEPPDERKLAGKEPVGTLILSITKEAERLVVKISDDGHGIDWEKIAQKAEGNPRLNEAEVRALVKKGETWKILLLPGFSSSDAVSEVSGRGIGLDAVDSAIKKLGGHLSIRSRLGLGTDFIFYIPLV